MATANVTPNGTTEPATKTVTKTVFDLTKFDDVKLSKVVVMPEKPATLQAALEAAGNNTEKILSLIFEGMQSEAVENAKNDSSGFREVNEDGEPGAEYTGKFADEEKGKLINTAILALAKMNGYEKSLEPAKKRELKEKATAFLRDNPGMLGSIQG